MKKMFLSFILGVFAPLTITYGDDVIEIGAPQPLEEVPFTAPKEIQKTRSMQSLSLSQTAKTTPAQYYVINQTQKRCVELKSSTAKAIENVSPLMLREMCASGLGAETDSYTFAIVDARGVTQHEITGINTAKLPQFAYEMNGKVQISQGGDRQLKRVRSESPKALFARGTAATTMTTIESELQEKHSTWLYEYEMPNQSVYTYMDATATTPTHPQWPTIDPREMLQVGKNLPFEIALPENVDLEIQAAVVSAAGIYGAALQGTIPVRMAIGFDNLTYPELIALEYTPSMYFYEGIWYPAALANQKFGFHADAANPDMRFIFNTAANIYYGLDENVPAGYTDFITLLLRQMTRGLGFYSNLSPITGKFRNGNGNEPYIFDCFTMAGSDGELLLSSTEYNRQRALVSNDVYFAGAKLIAERKAPQRLYAPTTYDYTASLSYWDPSVNFNTFMLPEYQDLCRNVSVADCAVLADLGWSLPAPTTPRLGVSDYSLRFGADTETQTLTLHNAGTDILTWRTFSKPDWVTISPEFGIIEGSLIRQNIQITAAEYSDSFSRNGFLILQTSPNSTMEYIALTQHGTFVDTWDARDDVPEGATQLTFANTIQTHGRHVIGGKDRADWFEFEAGADSIYHIEFNDTELVPLCIEVYDSQALPILYSYTEFLSIDAAPFAFDFYPQIPGSYRFKVFAAYPDKINGAYTLSYNNYKASNPTLEVTPRTRQLAQTEGITTITLRNTGSGTLTWNASEMLNWVSQMTPSSGTLAPGASISPVIAYTANTANTERAGQITITPSTGAAMSVLLKQAPAPIVDEDNILQFSEATGTASYNDCFLIPVEGPLHANGLIYLKVTGGDYGVDYLIRHASAYKDGYFTIRTENICENKGIFVYVMNRPYKESKTLHFKMKKRDGSLEVNRKKSTYKLYTNNAKGQKRFERLATQIDAISIPLEDLYVAQSDIHGREGTLTGTSGNYLFKPNAKAVNGWLTQLFSKSNPKESAWIWYGKIYGIHDLVFIKDMFNPGDHAKLKLHVFDPFKKETRSKVKKYNMARESKSYEAFKTSSCVKLYNEKELRKLRKKGYPLATVITEGIKDKNGYIPWVAELGGEITYSLSKIAKNDRLGAMILHVPVIRNRPQTYGMNVFSIIGDYFGKNPRAFIEYPDGAQYKTKTCKVKKIIKDTTNNKVVSQIEVTIKLPKHFGGNHVFLIINSGIGYSLPIRLNVDANGVITAP